MGELDGINNWEHDCINCGSYDIYESDMNPEYGYWICGECGTEFRTKVMHVHTNPSPIPQILLNLRAMIKKA